MERALLSPKLFTFSFHSLSRGGSLIPALHRQLLHLRRQVGCPSSHSSVTLWPRREGGAGEGGGVENVRGMTEQG